jgi:hypothetical protein
MSAIANFFFYGIGAVLVIVGIAAIVQIVRNKTGGSNVVQRAANWARNRRLSPEEALRMQVKETIALYRDTKEGFGAAVRLLSSFYPDSVSKTNDILNNALGEIEGHIKWHIENEKPELPEDPECAAVASAPLWEEE